MIKYSAKKKTGTIYLEGTTGIDDAAELKGKIVKAMKANEKVEIRVGRLESIDVSILQILYAAQKQCENDKKEFLICDKETDFFHTILIESGFTDCYSNS